MVDDERHGERPVKVKRRRAVFVVALFVLAAVAALAAARVSNGGFGGAQQATVTAGAVTPATSVRPSVFNGSVRSLPQASVVPKGEMRELEPPPTNRQIPLRPATQQPLVANAAAPPPLQNFAGLKRNDSCSSVPCGAGTPPDTNGAVGPSNYIQSVNSSYAIYSKTGTLQASFTENALFASSGTNPCNGNSFGDPVVVYDAIADRWILTNFAFALVASNPVAPYYECIAVSKTSNPVTGGWYLYPLQWDAGAVPANTLNDYPKFGVWNDCLYFSFNGFLNASAFNGVGFGAISRSDMYAGLPLHWGMGFLAYPANDAFTMIPSNLEAPGASGAPPAGRPEFFVSESLSVFGWLVRTLPMTNNCQNGTLSAPTTVSQTTYTASGVNVPQPGTANTLDSLYDRLLQKVQYRKVGSTESLWVTHTVADSGGNAGPQWGQLDVSGGTIATTPAQQQIYRPDSTIHRWMPSIAVDVDGNSALGYPISNNGSATAVFLRLA